MIGDYSVNVWALALYVACVVLFGVAAIGLGSTVEAVVDKPAEGKAVAVKGVVRAAIYVGLAWVAFLVGHGLSVGN